MVVRVRTGISDVLGQDGFLLVRDSASVGG